MKLDKHIIRICTITIALATLFSTAKAADIEWSGEGEFLSGSNWRANWTDGENWVGGVAPTSSDTAILNENTFNGRNYGYINTTEGSVIAKDMIVHAHNTFGINMENASLAGNMYVVVDGSNATFRVNSNNNTKVVKFGGLYVGRGRADESGNYALSQDSTALHIGYFDMYVHMFSSVDVENDVVIDGAKGTSTVAFGAGTVNIKGVVDMVSTAAANKVMQTCVIPNKTDVESRTSNLYIGGMRGSGTINSGNASTNGAVATSNIVINGSGENSFSGNMGSSDTAVFNISHTGAGKQSINLSSGRFNSVSVSAGTFRLATAESNGALNVSGGLFGSINNAEFASAEISGGGFIFSSDQFLGGLCDKITVSGKFSKNFEEKIIMDFNGLDAESIIGVTYDLLTAGEFEGLSTDTDANEYFTATNLENALADFGWNNNTLTVTFTQVPEPAAAAAAIGLAALAALCARRRPRK